MKETRIVRCTEEKRILTLINGLFPNARPGFSPEDVYFIAVFGDNDAGFLHLVLRKGRVLLQGVGVKPECRKKGIGGMLLDTALDFAQKRGEDILLKVKPDNVAALSLYAKKGFVLKRMKDVYVLQRKMHS